MALSIKQEFVRFFQLYLPWFDLLSIMPFYLELVMVVMIKSGDVEEVEHMDSHDGNNKVYTVLRVIYTDKLVMYLITVNLIVRISDLQNF